MHNQEQLERQHGFPILLNNLNTPPPSPLLQIKFPIMYKKWMKNLISGATGYKVGLSRWGEINCLKINARLKKKKKEKHENICRTWNYRSALMWWKQGRWKRGDKSSSPPAKRWRILGLDTGSDSHGLSDLIKILRITSAYRSPTFTWHNRYNSRSGYYW